MDFLNSIIGQVNTVLWSYVLIALLILSGLFYTLRTGFAQGRLLGDMVALITGKLSSLRDGESSFRWSNKYDWKYFGTNL